MKIDPKQYQPKELKQLTTDRQMCIVRFSPDGKLLVAGGSDGTIRRWDASDFSTQPNITGHGGWVQGLAFHGDQLFAADSWGKLAAWPFADKDAKPLWSVDQAHERWIRGLAVSPDGKMLATCGMDQKVRLWSAQDGKKLAELSHSEDVYAVAFHPDGKSLASGDLKGKVRIWDIGGKLIRELDASVLYKLDRLQDVGGVRCLAFDKEGKTLAVGGTQPSVGANVQGVPTLLLFNLESGKVEQTVKVGAASDGFVYDVHHHPAGFWMGVSSGNPGVGKLFFHQAGDAQPFFVTPKMANCHSLALHPEGKRLAISATNANSAGNGRQLKGNDYPGNWSPLVVWEMPGA